MQIQKEELKESILQIAENEFLKHGFKSTSMRVIAKKANTTQGNLYNYFSSKEEILDNVLGNIIEDIDKIFNEHEFENLQVNDFHMVNEELKKCDLNKLGFNIFLSSKFIILMEGVKDTKYENYREEFLKKCKEHFLWHLGSKNRYDNFVDIVAISFLNGVLFIAKRNKDLNQSKEDFIKLYQLICSGMISQFNRGGE